MLDTHHYLGIINHRILTRCLVTLMIKLTDEKPLKKTYS